MDYAMFFSRYEMKYLLTRDEKAAVMSQIKSHMHSDDFGRSCIRNIYFDTPNFRLIRNSLEKPVYKEKLRVRSYGAANANSQIFAELKKKYDSVVYKRRILLPERQAMDWLCGSARLGDSQVAEEIEYFRDYYARLQPSVFLSYDREAFFDDVQPDFRVTFDENICYRTENLSLCSPVWGTQLLESGQTLMELKTSGGIPLWMARTLSAYGIYQASYSKYGTAYRNMLAQTGKGVLLYA